MTQHDNNDDLLDRAIAGMKNQPVPLGPSDRTIADTLDALRQACPEQRRRESKPTSFWQRAIHMTLTQKIAAAIAMTIGGLTLYFVLTLFSGLSSVSYAQVADVIRAMKSMSCDVSVTVAGSDTPTKSKMLCMEPGKMRQEYSNGGIAITDMAAHRALSLLPQSKTATQIDTSALPDVAGQVNFVEGFKALGNAKGEDAGEKQIGDVKAKAFRVMQGNVNWMVYVDPKSRLPIRVEYDISGGKTKVVMDNINFDANLDESLFSTEPPPGYTLQKQQIKTSIDLSENLVPVLKAYASKKDGQFPPALDNWTEIFKTILSGTTKPAEVQQQTVQFSANAGAIMATFMTLEKGKTYDYLPDQVKLGEADKMLLWYQDRRTKTYKAIYGDLHVAEVTAEQLPKQPGK